MTTQEYNNLKASVEKLALLITTENTNSTAIKTAVEIMDDWDESDRAKVNLIVGQAGVAASTGITGVNTVRTAPSYYEETLIAGGTSASAANITTSASNVLGASYKYVAFQLNATSLDAADGSIKIQDSLDGTNFSDITGASITVASGTSVNMIRDTAFTGKYIRAVWTKGSNTAGTLQGLLFFK